MLVVKYKNGDKKIIKNKNLFDSLLEVYKEVENSITIKENSAGTMLTVTSSKHCKKEFKGIRILINKDKSISNEINLMLNHYFLRVFCESVYYNNLLIFKS